MADPVKQLPPAGLGPCSTCKFFDLQSSSYGVCRLNPPERRREHDWRWPVCRTDDWCGRWTAVAPP